MMASGSISLSRLLSSQLTENILQGLRDVSVSGVCLDSRELKAGDLFLALPGATVDGRDFISAAIRGGAAAVVAQSSDDETHLQWDAETPLIHLPLLSECLAEIVANFYNKPSRHLHVTGVTGTNGKTSCTHYLAQMLELLGQRCGVMGTLGSGFVGALREGQNTTSDVVTIQKFMAEMVAEDIPNVAMEVSSHGLEQGRTRGTCFTTAIFTNLTRDHLDYHGSMEEYARAKARLFSSATLKYAAINEDDRYAALMKAQLRNGVESVGFSLRAGGGDIYPASVRYTPGGIQATLVTPWGEGELTCPLLGEFNLANLLAIIAVLGMHGHDLAALLSAAKSLQAVDGRMQLCGGGMKPQVVIDYAHTPDALESLLGAVDSHCQGRITCVFGCGGDRDSGKRPLMLQSALKGAASVVVTSDNPRGEDPDRIIQDILAGAGAEDRVRITAVSDRAAAIRYAVSQVSAQDVVVVAGKGHERYQEVNGVRHSFSDQEQVELALHNWAGDVA
ncbi:UDP-N-acetylmuramoyl-L-alanyl-D-glutamate--2,6-diaminopimelate ligase [Aestuariirhabdus sp. LZHN29]|uniref:UDP-N-acetylmuramoyl-L-alanyl-D-glutamate--2, 6-diaminopimelate ligase n=1 Tax=Aestuariirhabdus sp. LZHN29 TaxID=3417462 RepID=UPI003CE99846